MEKPNALLGFLFVGISICTVACKQGPKGPQVRFQFIEVVQTNPKPNSVCNGQKVDLVIKGYSKLCDSNKSNCTGEKIPFSTQVEEGVETIDCSAFAASVTGWANLQNGSTSGQFEAHWEQTTTGVFDPAECTLDLDQPIPDTILRGNEYINRDRQAMMAFSTINGQNLWTTHGSTTKISIQCPKELNY